MGSFEDWCRWVRDPLLTLGCRDPVERVELIKAQDPHRQRVVEVFQTWDRYHGDAPVKAAELAEQVLKIIDSVGRGRQYVASCLAGLAGTRSAGFVLLRQEAVGAWGAATYSLQQTASTGDEDIRHRDHRDHRPPMAPMPPMPPMLDDPDDKQADTLWGVEV